MFSTDSDEELQGNVHVNEPVEGYLDISFEKESRNYVRYYSESRYYANFWKSRMVYCRNRGSSGALWYLSDLFGRKEQLNPGTATETGIYRFRPGFSFLHKLLKGRYTKEEFQRMVEEYRLSKLNGEYFSLWCSCFQKKISRISMN